MRRSYGGSFLFPPLFGSLFGKNFLSKTSSDCVKPGTNSIATLYRTRVACQDEKGCLEHILSQVVITENSPASTQNKRAVTIEKLAKCIAIVIGGISIQQGPIAFRLLLW
jgi:hypothetical protein